MISALWKGLQQGYYRHLAKKLNRKIEGGYQCRQKLKDELLIAQARRDEAEERVKELDSV